MSRKALIVWGGWKGHNPKEFADMFAPWLKTQGFEVIVSETLDSFLDKALMDSLSLVNIQWTMGQMTKEQQQGLLGAIKSGVGFGGWHGGAGDSFRNNPEYQFMVGGQWVAHPGNKVPSYKVKVIDHEHPITKGIPDFEMKNTEQYYMHVDPSNKVLANMTFESGCVMPVVWTRMWGAGRVFYSSLGHTEQDYIVTPEARTIAERGLLWAAR